jgi:ABC-type amino acid transport substrate-binding protein
VNPRRDNLAGLNTGVLRSTTTEQFLATTYPDTNLIPFEGITGREDGVQAVIDGTVTAFAGDGVLLMGEVIRQNLPLNDFALVPEEPLTCEFYGLALPTGDAEWRNMVNRFGRSEPSRSLRSEWFAPWVEVLGTTPTTCRF